MRDPKIDHVRGSLIDGISRVCFSLALGHFLCLPPLYWMVSQAPNALISRCITAITVSGVLLTLVAFSTRFRRVRASLSYCCLGVLFVQASYFLVAGGSFVHPITMIFPLLCSLATPILGRRASYATSAVSIALFAICLLFVFPGRGEGIPPFALATLVVVFSAHLTETLWDGMLRREKELRAKNDEMELWVQRLGQASSLISSGHSTTLPTPPPSAVFTELTDNMGKMQEKINSYFSDLLLKDRLNSLGVLASGVAHELNTPLTTMQFLLGREDLPAETREALTLEVQRMSAIAKGLLTFARPKDEECFDLGAVVRQTEALMKSFERKEVRLVLDLHDAKLPIKGTSNQVQQVLLNLFHNAADACEARPDPAVHITTRMTDARHATLTVRDNGCGIEPGTLSKILDPFFTTKPPGKGTGLGLFIVHQIVERHGATLRIESKEGVGTEVTLVFALDESIDKAKEAA